jgi:hypothetical protein
VIKKKKMPTQKYMFFIVGRLVKYKISSGQCDKKEKDAKRMWGG